MTQYSANPISKIEPPKPAKGSLVTYKEWNSPFFFFKIVGGGTIPKCLEGGWISQRDADNAQYKYEATKRPAKEGDPARQESEVYTTVSELQAASA